jgi:hypothetical protein
MFFRSPSSRFGVSTAPLVCDLAALTPAFTRLVDDTLAQVEACPAKPEPTFEGYESLLAAIRSATTLEGALIERGIELVAATNQDLVLVPLERPLPVHEVAKGLFRKNDWKRAGELRFDSRFVTREFYRPDILLVDGPRQLARILDVKRSVASYKPRALAELRARMMASALVVRDVLERYHDAPPVARADIAIIDAAGDCRDEANGILALDDLDWLLGVEGAGAAVRSLRTMFGQRVRAVLDQRCLAMNARHARGDRTRGLRKATSGGPDMSGIDPELGGAAMDAIGLSDARDFFGDEEDDPDAPGAVPAPIGRLASSAPARSRPRIAVGLASRSIQ